jgi:hypothetical protein
MPQGHSAVENRGCVGSNHKEIEGRLMPIKLIVRPGLDSAFLAWRAPFIPNCRGFALTRRVKRAPGSAPSPATTGQLNGFAIEEVSTWVGFANGPPVTPGTRKPSTQWPIQKYVWSDFMVNPGDQVAYRVTPMVGPAGALEEDTASASPWTEVVEIGVETPRNISCYFNRTAAAGGASRPGAADNHRDAGR